MRERNIIWDIAVVLLLFALLIVNGITLIQNGRIEQRLIDIAAAQQNAGNRTSVGPPPVTPTPVITVAPAPVAPVEHTQPAVPDIQPVMGTLYDGHDNPHWERGDEHADDGDWLVLNEHSEPNSLNPLIDNDATAADLFERANDSLVARSWDDPNYWEPRLASAWEKAMICRGIATAHNAPALAEKLNASLDSATREKLKIAKISAESDDILRIELSDATGDYREPVQKLLGTGAIDEQTWIYVSFEAGATFTDGSEVNGASVAKRLQDAVAKTPGFKGRFQPAWERETSVVLNVIGGGAAAAQAVKDYIDSPLNTGEVTDPKSATGKSQKKVLTFDVAEGYVFEEKPVFTFHLRKDVKWHDGEKFTGRDVIFSFETMMNPKVEAAPQRNYMQDCESVKLVNNDPFLVQFVWKKPYFLAFVQSAEITILPEHIFQFKDADEFNKSGKNQKLIGTGPYKLEMWDRNQHQLVYVRNEDYYRKKPHFKKIVCKFVNDPTVSLELLQAGELDIEGLTKAQAKQKINDPEFKKKFNINVSIANSYLYVGWNARRPLFADAKVRRALTMLVDRNRIISDTMRGYAVPLYAATHPESPTYPQNAERLNIPFDPAGAVKLLNAQGWRDTDGDGVLDKDGQPFKFTLLIRSGSPETESMANLIKDTFAQAGIVVNISNLEWSVLLQNIERLNFNSVIMGWQLGLDDDPYQLWHSSQTGEKASNFCDFVNPEVDRLIEAGRRELDEKKRNPMFQRVYEIIAEEQPYTLLFGKRTTAYDNRIQNVKYKLVGSEYERWWVPKALQKYK